jgi:hypothetical protein
MCRAHSTIRSCSLFAVALCFAILTVTGFAQSPAFPNTQPIPRQPFGGFPFRRIDSPQAPALPSDAIIFYTPRARPSDYPGTRGYGSSPYTRIYGGAGSVAPLPPEPQILIPAR